MLFQAHAGVVERLPWHLEGYSWQYWLALATLTCLVER